MSEKKKSKSTESKNENLSEETDVLDITTMAEYNRMKEELFLAKEAAKESMEMVKNFKMDVDRIKERAETLNVQLTEKITIELAKKLFPILDNFEKSLQHISNEKDRQGVEMIYNSIKKALRDMGVYEAEVAYAVFDPEKMEAIATVHTDNEDKQGMVCEVIRTGYFYEPSDKVIRYTQVAVFTTD
ncbi:MAG: nucleotide exchange factor GrpE [Clostridia bacterium]|nr:nucleotide exchange factor GrpE [Clostridia bacterium]